MKKSENASFIKNSPKDNLRSIAIIVVQSLQEFQDFFHFILKVHFFLLFFKIYYV